MKTLLFIVLKVLEVAALIAAYLGFSWCGWKLLLYCNAATELPFYHFTCFSAGVGPIIIIPVIVVMIYGIFWVMIPDWFKLNKKWVNKILD